VTERTIRMFLYHLILSDILMISLVVTRLHP